MKVKYVYSACIEVNVNGFKILTDPWFTEGAYDGAWYQFPRIDPWRHIEKPDLVYISHIHPDHYDAVFLKKLFAKFGEIPVIIPDLENNYLLSKGRFDGVELTPTRYLKTDNVEIYIEENDTGDVSDIDSALIVHDKINNKTLLNLNDCIFNSSHVNNLKRIINKSTDRLDFLALGYTGAGPYPQTYFDIHTQRELLEAAAHKKKISFFDRYKKYIEYFPARFNLPFAGEYILGGRLAGLNSYRGVADAFEVKSFDPNAIVLKNGGCIDLVTKEVRDPRTGKHSIGDIEARVQEIESKELDYEKEICIDLSKINFMRLFKKAIINARRKSALNADYNFIFSILGTAGEIGSRFIINTNSDEVNQIGNNSKISLEQYSEILIDYRYLYGLLTTVYHWNNAEVGSHYRTIRKPIDNFIREAQSFLNFFSIA